MPSLQNETNVEKLARWKSTNYGSTGGSAGDRMRALEGTVAIETDAATARIPVMRGQVVSIGSRVSNHRKTSSEATATVTGYEVRPNKAYHWVGIVVLLDESGETKVWEWDNTVLHP